MPTTPDEIDELKQLYGGVQRATEGGVEFFLLTAVALPAGCRPETADALLCPAERDGYPFRVYFSSQVASAIARNWNGSVRILERSWFAFSWKTPRPNLRLAQMVRVHLEALR